MINDNKEKKYLIFAGWNYGETPARRFYVSFKELVGLYKIDIKDCVDMSQVLNQIGLDVYDEKYIKLYPHRLLEDYILPKQEK